HIDLAAPGDEVFSTYPRELTSASPREPYGYGSGTSMATPFVAGAAALLLAADKTITPAEVYKRLIDHAIDLGPAGRDPHYGYGLLNVEAALRSTNAGPLITIDSPITGTTIVGTTTVAVKLSHPDKVSKVAFYLDDAKDNPVRTITE